MTEKQASKKEHSSAQQAKFHSFKQALKEKFLLCSRAPVLLGCKYHARERARSPEATAWSETRPTDEQPEGSFVMSYHYVCNSHSLQVQRAAGEGVQQGSCS